MAILKIISLVMDTIYRVLCEYSKVVLAAIVIIVSAQVISRKVLNYSIIWSEEVALLLMVWMAFISLAIGVEKRLHIMISIFFDRLPKRAQIVIEKITNVLMIMFGVVLVYYGTVLIQYTSTSTLPATKWPASTLYLMIPVSGVFVFYYSLLDILNLNHYKNQNIIGNNYN